MAMNPESKVTIKIPRPLYRRLKIILQDSGFDSVTDFIVFILRDIAAGQPAAGATGATDSLEADNAQLTRDEVERVRRRLRNLGYL